MEEASETLARFFMPAAEYCRLPGAPVERVSVASEVIYMIEGKYMRDPFQSWFALSYSSTVMPGV